MAFILFISFFIGQRISELLVAKKNEKWLRGCGAIEFGQKHYPFIVTLHVLFIASLIAEYLCRKEPEADVFFLLLFVVLLSLKIWVISSLGKFWNTKIFRVSHESAVKRGPYKFFKHPNYVIVVSEFIVVPLVFHLYYTAMVFSLLNAIILWVRIKEENRVWSM